jgi:hypothetical protein
VVVRRVGEDPTQVRQLVGCVELLRDIWAGVSQAFPDSYARGNVEMCVRTPWVGDDCWRG